MKKILQLVLLTIFWPNLVHAQLGSAPLPQITRVDGPSLEITQAWIIKTIRDQPIVKNKWGQYGHQTFIFEGCRFYQFIGRFGDGYAGRTVMVGNLAEIDPDSESPATIGYRKLWPLYFHSGEETLSGADALRYATFDRSLLEVMINEVKSGQRITHTSSSIISFPDDFNNDIVVRLNRAFKNLSKLCAVREAAPPKRVIKPDDEPF